MVLSRGAYALRTNGLIYKTASGISTAVHCCPGAAGKRCWDIGAKRQSPKINPSKAQALWCTLNKQSSRDKAMPAVSFNGEAHKTHENSPQITSGFHFDRNAYVQGRRSKSNKKLRYKKGTVPRLKSHGFKRHRTNVPSVSCCIKV